MRTEDDDEDSLLDANLPQSGGNDDDENDKSFDAETNSEPDSLLEVTTQQPKDEEPCAQDLLLPNTEESEIPVTGVSKAGKWNTWISRRSVHKATHNLSLAQKKQDFIASILKSAQRPVGSSTSSFSERPLTFKKPLCSFYERGLCSRGQACLFAHSFGNSHRNSAADAVSSNYAQRGSYSNEQAVFLGRLPSNCSYWKVRQWASAFGQFDSIDVQQGYAVISFLHAKSARNAILNYENNYIDDTWVDCKPYYPGYSSKH